MDTPGQQESKAEPADITQWIIQSMWHLRSCLMKGENSTALRKWPKIPKELEDNVWEETLEAVFKYWDKYWEGYTYMRNKYIKNAIIQTERLISKSSTSKCISKTNFRRGMLKDPYIVKIKDIWNSLTEELPFIESESESEDVPADSLPVQNRSTSCLSDWFLAFLQHLRGVLTSGELEYFVEDHVPKPPLSVQDICELFNDILATWNNLEKLPNDDCSYSQQHSRYLNAMHLIFVKGVPSTKKRDTVSKKLDKLTLHLMKQLKQTKKKSPIPDAVVKSKICKTILDVSEDSASVEANESPYQVEEVDEKQKKLQTSRSVKESQKHEAEIEKLEEEIAHTKCNHISEVQNLKTALEVILDDKRTAEELLREDTEKHVMEQWFKDLYEKISEFKLARSNEIREKEVENEIPILRKQLDEANQSLQDMEKKLDLINKEKEDTEKDYRKIEKKNRENEEEVRELRRQLKRDTFQSRLMGSLLTALENKTMALSFDLSVELGDNDEETKHLMKCHKKVQKILKRLAHNQEELQRQIEEYEANISTIKENRDQLLNRLSLLAGAKLKDNNPNITDLSDPNRPLKVAEQFSELYDKEWTNALEYLIEAKTDETTSIIILLDTVGKCYQFCYDESERSIDAFLICTESERRNMLEAHEHQLLFDTRKSLANVHIAQIKKKFTKENICEEDIKKRLAPFVEKSLELCWFMVTQSPPIHMEINFPEGTPMDKNVLKPYTVSGDTIAFVVWPALYLHKDGPLLSKGVAQPHPKPRKSRERKQRPSTAKT